MITLFEKGGMLMWPLLMLSIVSVTISIERFGFFLRESMKHKPKVIKKMLNFLKAGEYQKALDVSEEAKEDFIVRTLINGLKHHQQSLSRGLEVQAHYEMRRLRKFLPVLDTVITAAPLLGILGTVIGIIFSFDVLGSKGVSDPMAVTQGISVALITTAYGLTIALITLIPYNFFQNRYRVNVEELEYICSQLEIVMENNSSKDSVVKEG